MTTNEHRPRFVLDLSDSEATAPCLGTNHHDAGHRIGHCDTCGREIAKHRDKGTLHDVVRRGFYGARKIACWMIHTCDPEQARAYRIAKDARLARGSIEREQKVTVTKGRKFPKGLTGVVFFTREGDYGPLARIKRDDTGEFTWVAEKNITATNQLPTAPETPAEAPADVATTNDARSTRRGSHAACEHASTPSARAACRRARANA